MKNSKFLKLISLALTVALLVAVAVPTLTTSAEDTTPAYVKELSYTFEDGEKHTTASHVVTSDNEGVNGSKCIDITDNKNNQKVFFNDFLMKTGVTYFVSFNYKCYQPGTDNRAWFRPIQDDGAKCGTDASYSQTSYDSSTQWRSFSQQLTPNKDTKFGIITQDGFYVDNFYVVEMSTENTATKQTYTFDSHDFSYLTTNGKSITVLEKNQKISAALTVDTSSADVNAAPGQIQPILDYPLTAGKYYKLSYDIKGKGDIAISMTSGGWNKEQYKTEIIGKSQTSLIIDIEDWKHHESVFKAQHNSTHLFIRGSSGGAGAKIYLDNVVIEEYTPTESFTFDFENNEMGYNNYSIAVDPLDETGENHVLKCNNSNTTKNDYTTFYLTTMRLQKNRMYEISFKYYGGTWFRRDVRTSTGSVSRNEGVIPSTTQWKTITQYVTISENEDMGMIAIHCESTTYFDDFVIRDVTNTSTDSDKLDFSSETGTLINHTQNTTVTKEQDGQRETIVTKLNFNQKCNTDNGMVSLPFLLESGKTYVVNMTYKSDIWVAMQWAEKANAYDNRVLALNSNPLSETSNWTTVTRYVVGTNFDTIYFYSQAGGGNLYIADVTITEATEAGGLNGDAVIDATDYTLMRNRIFSAKRDDAIMFEKYADQNSDGTIDILDMVRLSLKSANNYR